MARKDKISMPSGGAGITRYFDDYKSKIEFKPGHIIFLAIVVIVLVLALHVWGSSFFG
ncbi:preprotein translocase subunit Sec61beta [Candidatus Woesearchaeota archaeon]|nr:preprotein translocase subunit Sec61beta [Candidatus Woesearchaeota archaeon]